MLAHKSQIIILLKISVNSLSFRLFESFHIFYTLFQSEVVACQRACTSYTPRPNSSELWNIYFFFNLVRRWSLFPDSFILMTINIENNQRIYNVLDMTISAYTEIISHCAIDPVYYCDHCSICIIYSTGHDENKYRGTQMFFDKSLIRKE